MRTVLFDTHAHERDPFKAVNARFGHDLTFLDPRDGGARGGA